ncbi:MAG TPA: DUF2600 family protein [Solirubrobacterales bacterium]|nr:DUF2600 family protein [Solirubrobacterales bacterium]
MRRELEETAAAASSLGAYLSTVLPPARRQLRRWGPLPAEKARNAEAVAVFATLAPRPARPTVVRAVIALQVAIDLRDELEEAGAEPDLAAAERLAELDACWRKALASLPAAAAVTPLIERAVERCEEGQRQTHAAAGDPASLQRWAATLAAPAGYRWWELAAGAGSSVAAHALIAAAADSATDESAARAIDAAYFPPIGALTVFLDDLVDRDADRQAGEHNYLAYYSSGGVGRPEEAAERLGLIAERAAALIERLPRSPRHRAILAGVAAYYLSAPEGATPFARPIRDRMLARLGPGARLLAGFTQLRRLAERKRPGRAGNPPGP